MFAENRDRRSVFWTLVLLASFLLCIYSITYNGVFRVDDEHILAARAQSLALRGEFAEPQVFGNQRVQALIPLGDQATQVEPAQSVLGAGLYRLASALGLGGAQALFSLNIYSTTLTAVVVFLIVIRLGYRSPTAVWCALLFGIGTAAWPYAMTYLRDSLAMLNAGLAFLGWLCVLEGRGRYRAGGIFLMIAGLLGGVLAKNTVVVLIPTFVITAGWVGLMAKPPGAGRIRVLIYTLGVAALLVVVSALLPETGPLARYSLGYYRFLAGHFLESIKSGFLAASLGPFVSPAKSIFLFSPPLILVLFGLRQSLKSHRGYTLAAILFCVLIALAQALFYRERWAGAFGFGLRYMLPVLHALCPLIAPVIDSATNGKNTRRASILIIVFAISVLIQLGGSIVDWRDVYTAWQSRGLDPYATSAAWDLRLLAIPGQLMGLLSPGNWSPAWLRTIRTGSLVSVIPPILALAFIGALIMVLRRCCVGGTLTRKGRILAGTITLLAFVLPGIPSWWAYRDDPAWGGGRREMASAMAAVEQDSTSSDVIVIDSYGTPLWSYWINRWTGPQPWYSLPYEIPGVVVEDVGEGRPSEWTVELVAALQDSTERLWYLTSDDAPDYGLAREMEWLEGEFTVEVSAGYVGEGIVEVARFLLRDR